jgi:hypothetical protein
VEPGHTGELVWIISAILGFLPVEDPGQSGAIATSVILLLAICPDPPAPDGGELDPPVGLLFVCLEFLSNKFLDIHNVFSEKRGLCS